MLVVVAVFGRVEQLMRVDDEKAHQGVVDGGLGAGLLGDVGGGVARVGADHLDLLKVAELGAAQVFELAADDNVEQLTVGRRFNRPRWISVGR